MPELKYKPFDLPLANTFTIARGSTDVQNTMIVQLTEDGQHGYGEATVIRYYGVSYDTLSEGLERVRPVLAAGTANEPEALLAACAEALPSQVDQFVLCAVDLAVHDLWGKLRGEPLHKLWGLDPADAPASNYTVGIDATDVMVEKMLRFKDWPIFKVKLGTPDRDIEIITELRKHTDAVFRVDANCGWTVEQTIEYAPELKARGVEFIEQPLPADQIEAMPEVFAKSALPVVADESCVVESDVDPCHGRFHGINVKLVKCGGLAPGRRMLLRAKELGMKCMVGCMTESSVGISAIAQVAPMLDYVDMDGAVLLKEDIAEGAKLERGVARLPTGGGSGARLLDGPL